MKSVVSFSLNQEEIKLLERMSNQRNQSKSQIIGELIEKNSSDLNELRERIPERDILKFIKKKKTLKEIARSTLTNPGEYFSLRFYIKQVKEKKIKREILGIKKKLKELQNEYKALEL